MKKLLVTILSFIMLSASVLGLTACGEKHDCEVLGHGFNNGVCKYCNGNLDKLAENSFNMSASSSDHVTGYYIKNRDDSFSFYIMGSGRVNDYLISPFSKESIRSIYIDDGVTNIGDHLFSDCDYLTSITIPNSVTSIGDKAFKGCSNLQYNEYSNALYLGDSKNPYLVLVKAKSEDIETCTINANCKIICDYAFDSCDNLISIEMPANVKSIGSSAFGSSSLQYNEYSNALYLGDSKNPYLVLVKAKSEDIETCTINANCKLIYWSAFSNCENLTSITIPASVISIGEEAFHGCCNLQTVTSESNSKLESIGYRAFSSCYNLTDITIPLGVTSIGGYAFYGCDNLQNIAIPLSVTSISNDAFYGCKGLQNITIPSSVTRICENAFRDCSNLQTVTFEVNNKLEYIGESAFSDCSKLKSIAIPLSVTSIGRYAFYDCSNLETVTLDKNCKLNVIHDYTFKDCSKLENIAIPLSVTRIGNYAFTNCSSLSSIEIPNNVARIGSNAFEGCSKLTSVSIAIFSNWNLYSLNGNAKISSIDSSTNAIYLKRTYCNYVWSREEDKSPIVIHGVTG